jgi:hypothetical protein
MRCNGRILCSRVAPSLNVLPAAFRVMCKSNEGLLHSGRYFVGKPRRHAYRRSSGSYGTQEELSSLSTALNPHMNFIHCITHGEASASRGLEPKLLQSVLQGTSEVLNFLKARPLNSLCYVVLCQDRETDHKSRLLNSKVKRLSRVKNLELSRE